jgi:hypothetical protein
MEEHVSPFKVGLKYGMYLGLASIVITLASHFVGLDDLKNIESLDFKKSFALSILGWAVIFGFLYAGLKFFREHNEGLLSLGEGFSVALFIGLFSAIILALYMMIHAHLFMGDLVDTLSQVIDMDEMPEEESEAVQSVMGFVTSPFFVAISSFFSRMFAAAIFGFIAALILRRE